MCSSARIGRGRYMCSCRTEGDNEQVPFRTDGEIICNRHEMLHQLAILNANSKSDTDYGFHKRRYKHDSLQIHLDRCRVYQSPYFQHYRMWDLNDWSFHLI